MLQNTNPMIKKVMLFR